MPVVSFPPALAWQMTEQCCFYWGDFQDCGLADVELPILSEPGYEGPPCGKFVGVNSDICNGLSPWMKRGFCSSSSGMSMSAFKATGSSAEVSA